MTGARNAARPAAAKQSKEPAERERLPDIGMCLMQHAVLLAGALAAVFNAAIWLQVAYL
jgi:hypothetical protein